MGSGHGNNYDYSFKILLIGDSSVGKSSLLLSFISNSVDDNLSPTIGVDFKIKLLTVGEKKLKLTIWDTAGQERFRTLTSSYYRGAQGIILVYDVTRRETFTNLSDIWAREVELYSTNPDCIKMLVGNKVDKASYSYLSLSFLSIKQLMRRSFTHNDADTGLHQMKFPLMLVVEKNAALFLLRHDAFQDSERDVTREEGIALAKECGCLFLESSAKTRENVQQCFEELASKILEVPNLLNEDYNLTKRNILEEKREYHAPPSGGCCS
ncbi:hypothetical protein IFM89_028836 [Coptis chinensis]|uniref:Uncharacterized protein n=1 Tax=Coptis chinensis TaxID=261450 RepID=A0A835H7C2_9MAGN|nr:hypothetical protein IFM89_028836 [Coptis chinensis]